MHKIFTILFFGAIATGCHSSNEKIKEMPFSDSERVETFFPVTDYLKGQLSELDSVQVTPLKTITVNGKTDSIWVKRNAIRAFAAPFLTPQIDSASMAPYFSEKSFLDQTIYSFTFTYDPKGILPDSLPLIHWDVYIDPEKNTVQRIYLVKENSEGDGKKITQLTWKSDYSCSIRTITQKQGKEPEIREEKMEWKF